LTIEYGRELGIDPKMIRAAGARIREAIDAAGDDVALHDTLLVVVGRGASDPDAIPTSPRSPACSGRALGSGGRDGLFGGHIPAGRAGAGEGRAPRVSPRRRVPYFLFSGILVTRIYDGVDAVAARYPEIEFLKAPYLNDHPLVLETFADRVTRSAPART
jgi:sirohydrochlorin cobaltochelatase